MEATAGRTSGVEVLRDLLQRRLPPPFTVAALDFALKEVEEGRVVFSLMPGEGHYNSSAVGTEGSMPPFRPGRQTALAQAKLIDEADRLLAHATRTCILFPFPAP
ncbi:hypothetical protein [Streptomyces sp. SD15]